MDKGANYIMNKDFLRSFKIISDEYGEDFELLNGVHESQLNFSDFIDAFVDKNVADVTIDANANASSKDIRSLMSEKGKSNDKLIAFNKIFYETKKKYGLKTAKEWLETEYNGGFYLHDFSTSTYYAYCYAYDLTRLATEGLFFLKNYNSKPPKHLTTFIDDVIEYISYMSNRSSGAVGIPNILMWTYYFWKKDYESDYVIKNKDYYIRQCFQKLIYRLNQPFMRIDQSAFVNVSIFDRNYIESLFGGVEYPDGTFMIDFIDELIEHQKVFMEVVSDIRRENLFTFPVLTYALLYQDGKFVDEEFARWCSDHNFTWNDSNFFNSEDVNTLSNCCRLLSSTTKLDAFINSIGGTALSIGSVKVNTMNLMRIVLDINLPLDEKRYLNLLKKRTILCCKTLDIIRNIIKRNIEKGLLPNYQEGAMELSKQYCTIGILGLYEVIEYFGYISVDEFGYKSYTDKGIELASKIFDVINDVKDNFTTEYSFNVESVPAERAAIILCQKDNMLYGKNDKFIYSNQWIPLSENCTIKEKIRLSSILDKKCSGGAIAHIDIENNFPNKDVAWDMLNYIAKNGVIYFAFNSKINECKNHHGFVGANICPECGEGVFDTYQRIVGYLVPTRSYSKDRFKEFTTRKWYEYSEMTKDL
jgi:ribonucleoside-triphosphate reductase